MCAVCGDKTNSPVASDPIGDRMFTRYSPTQFANTFGYEIVGDDLATIFSNEECTYYMYKNGTYEVEFN